MSTTDLHSNLLIHTKRKDAVPNTIIPK